MIKLLFFLFGLLAFTNCQKDDTQPQTPAAAVSGQYKLTSLRIAEDDREEHFPTLPARAYGRTVSGTVSVTAVSGQEAEVGFKLVIKATGQPDDVNDLGTLHVQKSGDAYNLSEAGQQVASIIGGTLQFVRADTNQQGEKVKVEFTAKK